MRTASIELVAVVSLRRDVAPGSGNSFAQIFTWRTLSPTLFLSMPLTTNVVPGADIGFVSDPILP